MFMSFSVHFLPSLAVLPLPVIEDIHIVSSSYPAAACVHAAGAQLFLQLVLQQLP
jgi:hypothetical protein